MVCIELHNVSKKFRVYHDKKITLKDRFLCFNKVSYEEHQVLKDIDLKVDQGQTIGIIGKNGSGKSTLLKLITKIIYPDRGEIITRGNVSSLLELGAGFHPDFSGRENIFYNASIFGLNKKEINRRLESIVDFSELEQYIDNPLRTYSSGMYLRLAFSVAIHVEPEILLIDEILAVGDFDFQNKCLQKIVDYQKKGVAIVLVTHSLEMLLKICDQVVWLENSRIKEIGPPNIIIPSYQPEFQLPDLKEMRDNRFPR